MVKGKGPKPKAGASDALAKCLGVAKYTRLKPGELQHEVDIRRKFTVKGSWWGDECPEDETDQFFHAEAVECTMMHHFRGVGTKQPAVRFVLTGAAASTVDESPLWMMLDDYSRFTDDARAKERAAEQTRLAEEKAAASGIIEVDGRAGNDEEGEGDDSPIRRAGIFEHFSAPELKSTEVKPHPTKPDRSITVKSWEYTCKIILPIDAGGDGSECGHTRTEQGSSSGNLFKHLRHCAKTCPRHKEILEKLEDNSKHTSVQIQHGQRVTMLSWPERFEHHIDYVCETYLDYAPLTRSTREGNRNVLSSLKPGYTPPTRLTQINMMEVMLELEDEEIRNDIKRWRAEIGPGCLGEATDGLTKHGRHYVTFNMSVIEDRPLRMTRFVLDYYEYAGSGDADALCADWQKMEQRYGIMASDRGVPTADGAAPQQLAIVKLTGERGRICANHQEARGANAAFKSRNQAADRIIRKYRGLSRFARKSNMYKADIKKQEKDVMNVSEPTEMVLPNETRWTGNVRTLTRTNEKEPAIRKTHSPNDDDGTADAGAADADGADSDSSSGSESESDAEDVPDRLSKNAKAYRKRLEAKALTTTDWNEGKDLESVMSSSMEVITHWQRQNDTTLENRLTLARALIVVNELPRVDRLRMTKTTHSDGTVSYERIREPMEAAQLSTPAAQARPIYAEEIKERFFRR